MMTRSSAAAALGFAALVVLAGCAVERGGGSGDATPNAAPGAAASAPAPAPAPVSAEQVAGTVHVCTSCHGLGGHSISPTFPNLAGQRADYIEVQLKAFRDHTRADPHAHTYMWGMAKSLSDPMIHALAADFAAEPPVAGQPGDPGEMAAGGKIFRDGVAEHDVPACQACHGEHAEGQEAIPKLAGQHREYLAEQLRNFASNARENEIMHQSSLHLSAVEIRDVTAYLAAQ
jgi:cytochrome c553